METKNYLIIQLTYLRFSKRNFTNIGFQIPSLRCKHDNEEMIIPLLARPAYRTGRFVLMLDSSQSSSSLPLAELRLSQRVAALKNIKSVGSDKFAFRQVGLTEEQLAHKAILSSLQSKFYFGRTHLLLLSSSSLHKKYYATKVS